MDCSSSPPEPFGTRDLRPIWWTVTFIGFLVVGSIVVYGQGFLIPLAVAIMLWQLINAIARLHARIGVADISVPAWLAAIEHRIERYLWIKTVVIGHAATSTLKGRDDLIDRRETLVTCFVEDIPLCGR